MLHKVTPYIYVGRERSVDGALISELKQPALLFICERASELNVSVDAIEQSLLCVAVAAIPRMLSRVVQGDGDGVERPTFFAGVHGQRHRGAGPKRSKQKVIRPRPGIGSSNLERFVSDELVSPGGDILGEPRRVSAHDDIGFPGVFGLVFH